MFEMSGATMAECDSSTSGDLSSNKNFKVIVVGDGGTGKSSYIARLNSEGFHKEYIATMGVEKHKINLSTTCGEIIVDMWDTAGQEKIGPLRDSYYDDTDAAVIFFDVTSRVTYKNVPIWHKDIERVCGNIPIVLCANKIDVEERKVKSKSLTYHKKHKMECFEMSVLERICLKEPLKYLLQQLLQQPDIEIKTSLDTSFYKHLHDINL